MAHTATATASATSGEPRTKHNELARCVPRMHHEPQSLRSHCRLRSTAGGLGARLANNARICNADGLHCAGSFARPCTCTRRTKGFGVCGFVKMTRDFQHRSPQHSHGPNRSGKWGCANPPQLLRQQTADVPRHRGVILSNILHPGGLCQHANLGGIEWVATGLRWKNCSCCCSTQVLLFSKSSTMLIRVDATA